MNTQKSSARHFFVVYAGHALHQFELRIRSGIPVGMISRDDALNVIRWAIKLERADNVAHSEALEFARAFIGTGIPMPEGFMTKFLLLTGYQFPSAENFARDSLQAAAA